LLNILFIVSKTTRWTPSNYVRIVVNFGIGIGLAVLAETFTDVNSTISLNSTPWPLPLICLAYFFVLVFNSLPKGIPFFFNKKNKRGRSADKGGRSMGLLCGLDRRLRRSKSMPIQSPRHDDPFAAAFDREDPYFPGAPVRDVKMKETQAAQYPN
jgi:hypothetical protein